ncbi:MAG: hypothetical protein ACOZNI_31005 [Myxococcota bacterium]
MLLPDAQTLWLSVALLLCLWLLTRVRDDPRGRRPARRTPLSEDELGRVVFEVARAADIDQYRGLFLMGAEVPAALGKEAEAYLATRSPRALEESLVEIGASIPDDAHYVATHVMGDKAVIEVLLRDKQARLVEIGTAVRVGKAWRLKDPACPELPANAVQGALPAP